MTRTMTFAAAAAMYLCGATAHAAEHNILVLGDGFFPKVTYANPGDTLVFMNVTETSQNILAKNDKWAIGPIAPNDSATLEIEPGVQSTFYNPDVLDDDGAMYVKGTFNFGNAPLD